MSFLSIRNFAKSCFRTLWNFLNDRLLLHSKYIVSGQILLPQIKQKLSPALSKTLHSFQKLPIRVSLRACSAPAQPRTCPGAKHGALLRVPNNPCVKPNQTVHRFELNIAAMLTNDLFKAQWSGTVDQWGWGRKKEKNQSGPTASTTSVATAVTSRERERGAAGGNVFDERLPGLGCFISRLRIRDRGALRANSDVRSKASSPVLHNARTGTTFPVANAHIPGAFVHDTSPTWCFYAHDDNNAPKPHAWWNNPPTCAHLRQYCVDFFG